MRFSALLLLLSACAQQTPTPYAHDPVIMDAGTTIPMQHRLRVGHYVTGDGMVAAAPFEDSFFDPAFNASCFPAKDATDSLRCFPNVGYQPRAYKNGCVEEVTVAARDAEGTLRGSYAVPHFRLNRIGPMTTAGTYWELTDGACLPKNTTLDELVYSVGDDITATLETFELRWSED